MNLLSTDVAQISRHKASRRFGGIGFATCLTSLTFLSLSAVAAQAGCASAGGVTTCTGDVSGGTAAQNGDSTLNVLNTTTNIQPAGGTSGAVVSFTPGQADGGGNYPFVGGDGDNGSNSSNATVSLTGSGAGFQINTNNAFGIVAQSKGQSGGGGGDGGAVLSAATGGDGGNGGRGGDVNITTFGSGTITTTGTGNHGILGLSVGGNGGNGGDGDGYAGFYASGGDGGKGGAPGSVTINNVLDITTNDVGAAGIWAQSVGAGGGSGGSSGAANLVGKGGDGAPASDGGTVLVTENSKIITKADKSFGIFAQSIGGFAGSGGGTILSGAAFAGTAESAGKGGPVTVNTNGGSIQTSGVGASGIYAQSVGGGGGAGGVSVGLVGLGGGASSGGEGGAVTVENHASITVTGNQSSGIYAQSVGGGGGSGGASGGLVSLGGNGGGASKGGDVEVHNYGNIAMSGSGDLANVSTSTGSYGIFAQSVGGGGGDGGASGGLVSVGGGGGSAGDGGKVTVTNNADITGTCSPNCILEGGIFAQSVGGGGGNGAGSGGLVSIGGDGSAGGNGGVVDVESVGGITTHGDYSNAIFAQSIGGGGGNGAGSGGLVSIGGNGDVGGNGQDVTADSNGKVETNGYMSNGVFAQSVGGGGGNGAGSGGLVSIGGAGKEGGSTGAVKVTTGGSITTTGNNSAAIFAQSIGGGGGNGGGSGGLVSIGGSAGGGGTANTVTVNNSAKLQTGGQFSDGIFAQSVGGGGGNGGFSGGMFTFGGSGGTASDGKTVTVTNSNDITTTGQDSNGIFAQSVGGGGGNGGSTVAPGLFVSVGIGGKGGPGGNGGDVNINQGNTAATGGYKITTTQDRSSAVMAQSVGGGGGNGGFAVGAAVGLYGAVQLGFGGSGGSGGTGGNVYVGNNGTIETSGVQSVGIDAESIGGGGGNGGFAISVAASTGGGVAVSMAGNGGAGNNGGLVNVNSFTNITTGGALSDGIYARSIGGGGGNGGFTVGVSGGPIGGLSLGFGGTGGDGGYGSAVEVDSVGSVTTNGVQSSGIVAQSVGGGGGNGGFSVTAAGGEVVGASLSFGGAGADGGSGNTAKVYSTGAITTTQDLANGIVAQSIGGGGGNGGFSVAVGASLSGAGAGLALGGTGGGGSTSSTAHVTSVGDISTQGQGSDGILAQSISGGGGNGGFAGSLTISGGAALSASLGGSGGDSKGAGEASVDSHGNITTAKANANGIQAQSIGGGGGNGGFSISVAGGEDAAVAAGKAGGGGGGGTGGTVNVKSLGTVTTQGDLANGIFAQSVGGGGGNGGFAIAGGAALDGPAGSFGLGGSGGTGNTAGSVTVEADADTATSLHPGFAAWTQGNGSNGILAQSIGGGGGNGGFAITAGISTGGVAGSYGLGGSGDAGGDGNTVKVTTSGNIHTGGQNADGILAQSIGGGGGNGGFAIGAQFSTQSQTYGSTTGGTGSTGSNAVDVTVNSNFTAIDTHGANSNGIAAQSIGGGGGNGGFAINGGLSTGGKTTSNAVGGSGSGGGNGGTVHMTTLGDISTDGQNANGILAQSIGGGGGNGAFSISAAASTKDAATSSSVGGGSDGGGHSDTVTLENTGNITTNQDLSNGILAQSVGGGGGNGGFAIGAGVSTQGNASASTTGGGGAGGGYAGDVTVKTDRYLGNELKIETFGQGSNGILAQSIGGGGGNGGFAIGGAVSTQKNAASNTVGGVGAAGSDAGAVTVTNTDTIITHMANSNGIAAESIGGGGGNGGFAISGAVATNGNAQNNTVGGSGQNPLDKGAGLGKAVTVNSTATLIHTMGDNSNGILAESIGGGGGNGGFAIGAGVSTGGKASSNSVGGSGGAAGDAGDVKVTSVEDIITEGFNANGIFAQSVGGGGGNGSFSISGGVSTNNTATTSAVGGDGAGGGHAGDVTVDSTGNITTVQALSNGILAQSIGGGGGNGGFAIGAGGSSSGAAATNTTGGQAEAGSYAQDVTVTTHAPTTGSFTIQTAGDGSNGIFAQSVGGSGGNGGFAISGTVSTGGAATANSTGGQGGAGADAGIVTVTNADIVSTGGRNANGILAQSIGGGGGNGGFAISGGLSTSAQAASNTVGGSGGEAGNGKAVTVNSNSAGIATVGDNSTAVLAQSVGGGGGNGGFAIGAAASTSGKATTNTVGGNGAGGGNSADVTVGIVGDIVTSGANSSGIFAQSVGGGGGNGGFAIGGAGSTSSTALANSLGGSGSGGGHAGAVTVDSTGGITTNQALSTAIVAQSIGGGGGNGGFSIAGSVATGGASTANSTGGNSTSSNNYASDVTVTTHAPATGLNLIETFGSGSGGILAQSVGGGGGNGGFSISGTVSTGGGAVSNSIGGKAGSGNKAGKAIVANADVIITHGDSATGILAQSIGGGGGNGGFSIGGGGSSKAQGASSAVGGNGGSSGTGAAVSVTNTAGIQTFGLLSHGIVAQSIGGGGGNGGFAISGGVSLSGDAVSSATGGQGGSGNDAGTVDVNNSGMILTGTAGSYAILAQSIGGGGGNGGFAGNAAISTTGEAISDSTGGSGAAAGSGKAVTVINSGALGTTGDRSVALFAQSVGGGGGTGGFSLGAAGSNADAMTQGVGGKGGAAGNGDDVTVINNVGGAIQTNGAMAYGIEAQSIGGGGGNGGFTIGGALSLDGDASSTIGGGAGGAAGTAGAVTVSSFDQITTGGVSSIGIFAQSVGGGGGAGGFAGGLSASAGGAVMSNSVGGAGGGGGSAGAVKVTNGGVITTLASNSIGILAQSVGGGGGNGGFSLSGAGASGGGTSTAVGGTGAGGGNGDQVTVINQAAGSIETDGALSYGILAQSIGGGGGNGGFAIGGALTAGGDAASKIGGGAGGGGGTSEAVEVDNDGQVVTRGLGSIGIFAQSVGGGGGSGGFAGALSVSSGGGLVNSVGGAGGVAGDGGVVTVNNTGVVLTQQANSVGIVAQSIGGGGGNGGFSISGSGSSGSGTNTGVGGTGAGGGEGKLVTVNNSGSIETDGALSIGVLAQSVGGGGGNGGFAVGGTLSGGSSGNSSTVGGSGAGGGAGGDVVVTNSGSILTKGAGSVGVFAQSVGGGGGSAGFSGSLEFNDGGAFSNSVGGSGGNGGAGGNVTVKSTGSIQTIGDNSVGVLAQSIGGGGGNGTYSLQAQIGGASGVSESVGGAADGVGGTKGVVDVEVSGGTTVTSGAMAFGLLAQSIGSGGGNAAMAVPDPLTVGAAGVELTLGASGGISGDGNVMTASNSNPTQTTGAGAFGLVAQSIGGGGGTTGVTGDVDFVSPLAVASASVGGSSLLGGSGLGTTFSNTGSVRTFGDNAIGATAQSIGGGGGLAAYSLGVVTGTPLGVTLTAGGAQGAVGNGAAVTETTFSGNIQTSGTLALGSLSQSIGGGGGFVSFVAPSGLSVGADGVALSAGSTGGAGGNGDVVNLTASGSVLTSGAGASGLVAQSIGAGGGVVGFANIGGPAANLASVKLGSTAAVGDGAAVTLTSSGPIQTQGTGAIGVLAQSIGGGGGLVQAFGTQAAGSVTLGSSAGGGGSGGAVTLTNTASVTTGGTGAHAVVAQSVGGGGGIAQAFAPDGSAVNLPIEAGAGGVGGNGDTVILANNAAVLTTGAGADGVVAQSVGGGGGLIGSGQSVFGTLDAAKAFSGTVGGAGTGGAVTLANTAAITVTGSDSIGLLGSSAGGTGSGAVGISTTATISASGQRGIGILGQSTGGAAAGPITIDIADVAVTAGTGGHAVSFIDGSTNLLTNNGALYTADGLYGLTITGTTGNDNVVNTNYVKGSIDLGGGVNTFDNKPNALFVSGPIVNLNYPGTLTNEGTISPGDINNPFLTSVTGSFNQTASGHYPVDIEFFDGSTDRINATGTSSLNGVVDINILNPGLAVPGDHKPIIVQAQGGVTNDGLSLAYIPTAVATYKLEYPNATDAVLDYNIDFSPQGLTTNEHSVGNAINTIQLARVSPKFVPIAAALFYVPTVAQLGAVYDGLSGEGVSGTEQTGFQQNDEFLNMVTRQTDFWRTGEESTPNTVMTTTTAAPAGLSGYADTPSASVGPFGAVRPQRTVRVWSSAYGDSSTIDGKLPLGAAQLKDHGYGAALGVDALFDPHFIGGIAVGGGEADYRVPDRATQGHVQVGHIAAYGAGLWGNFYTSGVVSGDFFHNTERRFAAIPGTDAPLSGPVPGIAENLDGEFNARSASGRFETGYQFAYGPAHVTPFGAVQFSQWTMDTFSENTYRPTVLGLKFENHTVTSLPTFLGVQLDAHWLLANDMSFDPWVRASWVHEFAPRRTIEASFQSAPGFLFGIDGTPAAKDTARVNAGVSFRLNKSLAFFASFDGQFGDRTEVFAGMGGFKASW